MVWYFLGVYIINSNKFILVKQQLCTCTTLFCTFFSNPSSTTTSYFHAPALRSWWTKHKKFLFSFSKLRYGFFEFNPENFAKIWQIKWNWIRSMKFETMQIYFLCEVSVCCHPKIFLPWQRDVTTFPLYYGLVFGLGYTLEIKELIEAGVFLSAKKPWASKHPR